ncbi:MAG: putative small protein [Rhodobacteraceae bacterium HLUCCO18]|nr:MAG: putative small protein [Rhodobacteraceae bacterium HLUCCO18]
MSLGAHLQELKKKHANLSERVEQAQRSPSIDDLDIRALKKEKLRVKEEIARLEV